MSSAWWGASLDDQFGEFQTAEYSIICGKSSLEVFSFEEETDMHFEHQMGINWGVVVIGVSY